MSSSASSIAAAREGAPSRRTRRAVVWLAFLALLVGIAVPVARSIVARRAAPPVLGAVPAFELVDQQARPFGTRQLAGKPWIANFIFTTCTAACPRLSEKMAEIDKRLRGAGADVHLVSFTVDPERDTPARLAAYGARYGADPRVWSFLTGPMDRIQSAVVDGFKVGMGREKRGDFWEIFHGEHLVLVDRALNIRGYYSATPNGTRALLAALAALENAR